MSGFVSRHCQVRYKPFCSNAEYDARGRYHDCLAAALQDEQSPTSGSRWWSVVHQSFLINMCTGPGLGHTSTVWGAAFEAGGKRMVSCSDDCTLKVHQEIHPG